MQNHAVARANSRRPIRGIVVVAGFFVGVEVHEQLTRRKLTLSSVTSPGDDMQSADPAQLAQVAVQCWRRFGDEFVVLAGVGLRPEGRLQRCRAPVRRRAAAASAA